MTALKRGLMIAALCVAALSMVVEPRPHGRRPVLSSTAFQFYRELWHPQQEPYTPVIAWIKSHVHPGDSLYMQPDWMTYPVMFRASEPIYAWQISEPFDPEYAKLPDIHFAGRVAPDYLIAFGPFTKEMAKVQAALAARGVHYDQIDTIPVYWKDQYRPERIWRTFVSPVPKSGEEIYIYQRKNSAASASS